jgi:hypothetical protein
MLAILAAASARRRHRIQPGRRGYAEGAAPHVVSACRGKYCDEDQRRGAPCSRKIDRLVRVTVPEGQIACAAARWPAAPAIDECPVASAYQPRAPATRPNCSASDLTLHRPCRALAKAQVKKAFHAVRRIAA